MPVCFVFLAITSNVLAGIFNDTTPIQINKPIKTTIARPALHNYRVSLNAQTQIRLTFEHFGSLLLTFADPNGQKFQLYNDPVHGSVWYGQIPSSAVYLLQVESKEAVSLEYRLLLEVVPLTKQGQKLISGCVCFASGTDEKDDKAAIVLFRQALEHWKALGRLDLEAAAHRECARRLNRMDLRNEEILESQQAISRFRLVGNRKSLFDMLILQSRALRLSGQKWIALSLVEEAEQIAETDHEAANLALARNEKGLLLRDLRRYRDALEAYTLALEYWKKVGIENYQAIACQNLAFGLESLARFDLAEGYFNDAERLASKHGMKHVQAGALLGKGWLQHRQGKPKQAIDTLSHAFQLYSGNVSGELAALERLGMVYKSLARWEAAERTFEQAVRTANSHNLPGFAISMEANLGLILVAQGKLRPAHQLAQKVVAYGAQHKDETIQIIGSRLTARIAAAEGDWQTAWKTMRPAIQILEKTRIQSGSFEARTSLTQGNQPHYQFYLDLCMKLHEQQPKSGFEREALAFIEQTRGRSLMEVSSSQPISSETSANMSDLSAEIADRHERYQKLSEKERASPKGSSLRSERQRLLWRYDQKRTEAMGRKASEPLLPAPKVLSLEEIQKELSEQDILMVVAQGEVRGYVWFIDKKSVQYITYTARELEQMVRDYLALISARPSRLARSKLQQLSHNLSSKVLWPLKDKPKAQRLLVMGEGPLLFTPLGALNCPGRWGTYLVEHYEVAVIPSLSVLKQRRRQLGTRPSPVLTMAVFADPIFSRNDSRLPSSTTARVDNKPPWRRELPRLLATGEEAREILTLLPKDQTLTAMGADATVEHAQEQLDTYQVIHFATHGLEAESDADLAGLALSSFNATGTPIPGTLYNYMIGSLNLNAALVTLSACETAKGKFQYGEGISSLGQGFLKAGARSVIESLWRIDDRATAGFMAKFYQILFSQNISPSAALHRAQADMAKAGMAPFYWAAFMFQGEYLGN